MRVSVCIPTYNQGLYLENAIRSVLRQSLMPFEIIVSDDASTDSTVEILNRLSGEIDILKIIRQPVNLGISKNVDSCLRAAKGDYVLRLDSDDALLPNYLANLVGHLQMHPMAGYAHASVLEIDRNGDSIKQRRLIRNTGFQTSKDAVRAAISGFRVAANVIIFRREALEKVGYIRNDLNFAEDYYLCTSISASGYGNFYLDEVLSNYRVWMDAGKVRQKRKLAEINGLNLVFTELLEPYFNEDKKVSNQIRNMKALFACRHSDCLGWSEYTQSEKIELSQALDSLSASKRAAFVKWIYSNGYGEGYSIFLNFIGFLKNRLKNLILRFRRNKVKYSFEILL